MTKSPSTTATLTSILKRGLSLDSKSLNSLLSSLLRYRNPRLPVHVYSQFSAALPSLCETDQETSSIVAGALLQCHRFEEAEQVIARGERSGLPPRKRLWDALMRGICVCGGNIQRALTILQECARIRGVLVSSRTFQTLVSAFCEVGDVKGAAEVVDLMRNESLGYRFDDIACGFVVRVGVIELCKRGKVEKAIGFLENMENKGLGADRIAYILVMRHFCRKGKLQEAVVAMRKLEGMGFTLDEVMYSTLIGALCRNGDISGIFDLLREVQMKRIKVGDSIYSTVVNGLCKYGETPRPGYLSEINSKWLLEAMERLEQHGFENNIVGCNVLIKVLFRMGMVENADFLFERMKEMGMSAESVPYCTLVCEFCKVGLINKALDTFDEYKKNLVLNATCHSYIIRGLCKEAMVEKAIEVFQDIVSRGLAPKPGTCRMLMKALFAEDKERGVLRLLGLLEKLEPLVQCSMYNDCIAFLCKRKCFEAVMQVYTTMKKKGFEISSGSYCGIIKRFLCKGKKQLVQLYLAVYIKDYGMSDSRIINVISLYLCEENFTKALNFLNNKISRSIFPSVSAAVFRSLIKTGRSQEAYKFVTEAADNGVVLDVITCSIIVDRLCKGGHLDKALELCSMMQNKGAHLNMVTYNSVINGLCQQGCLVEALRLFNSLKQNNFYPTIVTYGTLIDFLCREGLTEDAEELFKMMLSNHIAPNTHIYNSMIYGYSGFSMKESLKYLRDMERDFLQPEAFTVSAVINGFYVKGDVESGLRFYVEYKRKGIFPDFSGFASLIKGFFIRGRMEEARGILRDMLQCQSVTHTINKAGHGIEVESLARFLSVLCEEGRIKDAVNILNDIGHLSFSSTRTKGYIPINLKLNENGSCMKNESVGSTVHRLAMKPQTDTLNVNSKTNHCNIELYGLERGDEGLNHAGRLLSKPATHDFDTFFSVVRSLCSKGELHEASIAVRAMMCHDKM